ncbi:hypothetical protein [Flavobacterium sp.]|jgi:hypothetical protein
MKSKISFTERAEIAKKLLSEQLPITLEQAKEQALWLKKISNNDFKKQRK